MVANKYSKQIIKAPSEMRFSLKTWKESDISLFKSCEVGIVADFGYFLPKDFINAPKNGFINLHPSLLPKVKIFLYFKLYLVSWCNTN